MERINQRLQTRVEDAEKVIEQVRLYEEWCSQNHIEHIPDVLLRMFQLRQNYEYIHTRNI